MEYQLATLLKEKMEVILKVLSTIQVARGGRFLNRTKSGWEGVTDEEVVRQKISQALRDEGRRIM